MQGALHCARLACKSMHLARRGLPALPASTRLLVIWIIQDSFISIGRIFMVTSLDFSQGTVKILLRRTIYEPADNMVAESNVFQLNLIAYYCERRLWH